MNAIVKSDFNIKAFTRGMVLNFNHIKRKIGLIVLFCLTAALSMIYVNDLNRCLLIKQQKLVAEEERLMVEQHRLMLEYSSLCAQARIQQLAQNKLRMRVPSAEEIVMIKC